jgi:anti-sigma B factor antagonist
MIERGINLAETGTQAVDDANRLETSSAGSQLHHGLCNGTGLHVEPRRVTEPSRGRRTEPNSEGVSALMSSFSIREEPDALVVTVLESSALNDFRSNSFRDSLYELVQDHPQNRVACDLTKVDFLSSSGVAILVGLKRRLDTRQGRLVLFGVQPVVHDLLRITRLSQFFAFVDTEAEALALLRTAPPA